MIINFGSINIDHVYRVAHMPAPGETLAVESYEKFLGGKGANQSIAIARAGGEVRHVGAVGADGTWALDALAGAGLDISAIDEVGASTGHAIVVVDRKGENQILISGGANQALTLDQVRGALDIPGENHWVLLQNETNLSEEIVGEAKQWGHRVAYSAAPFDKNRALPLLPNCDLVAVNEHEAGDLANALNVAPEDIPVPRLLVTKGAAGAEFYSGGKRYSQEAFEVEPVDTTGAGDTFLGTFLALYCADGDARAALRFAAAASALQVTRPGAANAIPERVEVERFLKRQPGP